MSDRFVGSHVHSCQLLQYHSARGRRDHSIRQPQVLMREDRGEGGWWVLALMKIALLGALRPVQGGAR